MAGTACPAVLHTVKLERQDVGLMRTVGVLTDVVQMEARLLTRLRIP